MIFWFLLDVLRLLASVALIILFFTPNPSHVLIIGLLTFVIVGLFVSLEHDFHRRNNG